MNRINGSPYINGSSGWRLQMVKQIAHIYIQIRMYKASEQKNIYPLGRDSRHFKLTFRRKTKYFNDN